MEIPQKTKNSTIISLNDFTFGHITGENHNLKNMYTPIFTTALYIIAMTWKQPKCPSTEEWIKKRWYMVHIYTIEY